MENLRQLKIKTIEKLNELKNNLSYDNEDNYYEMINIMIDYDNEAQDDLYLHDSINDNVEFVDDESLKYYVEYQFKEFGPERLFYMTRHLQYCDSIYKINAYGNLENVDNYDFLCCINNALDKLKESLA